MTAVPAAIFVAAGVLFYINQIPAGLLWSRAAAWLRMSPYELPAS